MGLIGCYLAFDNEKYYQKYNSYGNIIYPNIEINGGSYNPTTLTDIIDISNNIGMYETSNNGPYDYIATKSTNINVNQSGSTYIYLAIKEN